MLFSHEYCRVQCMVAIIPPSPSYGYPLCAPVDMDPNASRGPTSANTTTTGTSGGGNATVNTPHYDPSTAGVFRGVDELLIVDHMYRVRLFRFGYNPLPGDASEAAVAGSGNVAGMETPTAVADAAVAAMTTGMWTAAATNPGASGSGVTPIIMALQTALFPHHHHQQQHHRIGGGQLRAGLGISGGISGLPPPPIRQSTSDSSFGMGIGGLTSSRLQTPSGFPASSSSASTPGSLVGMLLSKVFAMCPCVSQCALMFVLT